MNTNLTPSKILTPITPNKTAKKQNSEEQLIERLLADDPDRIKMIFFLIFYTNSIFIK